MFYGTYYHSLDAKNRCRIPARLRSDLGDGTAVIVKGAERCLYIYSQSQMDSLSEQFKAANVQAKNPKALKMFMSSMFGIEEDGQNRFTLNSILKEYANIDKEIVFIGVNNRIEVWDKKSWEEYQNVDDDTASKLFETLAEYGL